MDKTEAPKILAEICKELLSYEEADYRHVLETYFSNDATLSHPLLTVEGPSNILKVFRVWTSLNGQEPTLEETPVYNGHTAVLKVTQHLRPRVLPFVHIQVPSVTTLTFCQGDDGMLYITKQKDDWTLEGLIQSVPLVNWWYNHVVRKVFSGLFTQAGSFLANANHATSHLRENSRVAINIKTKEYLGPFTDSYINPPLNKAHEIFNEGLSKGQDITDRATSAFRNVHEGVKNKFSKVMGGQSTYTNGNISPDFSENMD